MSSHTVADMAIKLGVDASSIPAQLRGVTVNLTTAQKRLAAEMKTTAHEGGEAFRLLSESIGINVSRPLARILTQEFPAFAAGLQKLLGGAVFGAVATVAVEAFDKIARSIERAEKAQEEWQQAGAKVSATLETIGETWRKKIASLSEEKSLAAIFSEGAAEARKQWEDLSKAIDEADKKRREATSPLTQMEAGVGGFVGNLTGGAAGRIDTQNQDKMRQTAAAIREALSADERNGTHTALTVINSELDKAKTQLKEYERLGATAFSSHDVFEEQTGFLEREITLLQQAKGDIEGHREAWEKAAGVKLGNEQDLKNIRELQAALKGWNEEANESWKSWIKTNTELEKAIGNMNELTLAESARRAAHAKAIYFPQVGTPTAPQVAPQRSDLAELVKIQNDQNAATQKAAEVLNQIETPAQKYATALAILKALQDEDKLSAEQVAQATQVLNEQMVKAASATQKLQDQMMKLLEHSADAGAGMKAFLIQLQITASENAKFVYDAMTAATSGAESTAADSLVKIIESHKDQHQKLIHELRAMWESYFGGLAKMAVQQGLHKLLATGAGRVEKMLGIAPKEVGKDAALSANTVALQQLTAAITAKAGVIGSGAGVGLIPGAGGGAGAGAGAADITNLEGFAEGGNVSPGGSFISGEAGAERVDLERGGAHVTPLGGTAGGVVNHNNYDMRGAVVTDDLLRKAEAAEMMEHTRSSAVAAAVSISREASLRARPQR